MNATYPLIALSAALAAGMVNAQEATLFRGDPGYSQLHPARAAADARIAHDTVTVIGRRSVTRAEIEAELMEAIRDGSLDRSGEARYVRFEPWNSTLTRAEVVAGVLRARANGTLDTSGEHWSRHDRIASAHRAERIDVASNR